MANSSEERKTNAATVLTATRRRMNDIADPVDMAHVRGSYKYPEVGTSECGIHKAADANKHDTMMFKKTMTMMIPSIKLLAQAHQRARFSLARPQALPHQPEKNEIAK